jgi:murein DD-endopeptidase MepM/ murein hydrolase activator NlpD
MMIFGYRTLIKPARIKGLALCYFLVLTLLALSGCAMPAQSLFQENKVETAGANPHGVLVAATSTAALRVFRHYSPTPPTPWVAPTDEPSATALPTYDPTQTSTPVPTIPLTPTAGFQICSPVAAVALSDLEKVVSDAYTGPPPGSDQRHEGVDFAYYRWKGGGPIRGTPIQAVLAGKVAMALTNTFPYGNVVIIETPRDLLPNELAEGLAIPADKSLYLLYAHMEESLQVSLGDEVAACQPLGAVGSSGNAVAAHLHLETRTGPPGAVFLAMARFIEDATAEEKENYRIRRVSRQFLQFDPMLLLLFGIK